MASLTPHPATIVTGFIVASVLSTCPLASAEHEEASPDTVRAKPTPTIVVYERDEDTIRSEELERIMEGQSEQYQEVIRLRQSGLSNREIAEAIGMSTRHVRRIVRKLLMDTRR